MSQRCKETHCQRDPLTVPMSHHRLVAVVLMAELSGAITLVPVIAVACAIATFVGNLFGPGEGDPVSADVGCRENAGTVSQCSMSLRIRHGRPC